MALEDITAGSTIADLNTANPASGDNVNQGDDHLRNIKKAVQFTFMNVSATVSSVAAELDVAHKGGTISGALNIKSTLTAEGAATLKAGVSVSGAVGISGDLSTGGNTNLGGTLSVSGAATIKGTVTVEGAATIKGSLSVSGTIAGQATSANFANSASFAHSASRALFANSASFAHSASRALFAFSASFAYTASRVNSITPLVVRFDASGTIAFNPNSLTVLKVGTGRYRVTHNFGNTNYVGMGTPLTGQPVIAWGISADSSSIEIATYDVSANAHVNAGCSVLLVKP